MFSLTKQKEQLPVLEKNGLFSAPVPLSLDRTLVNYQITVTCNPGNCLVELEKIRFTYRETEKYKAEEWITDKYALNKAKTKLVRGLAKWRRKTVDFADDIFMDVAVAFGAPDTRPKTEKKKKEEEQKLHQSLQPQARLSLVAQIKRLILK